VRRTLYWKRLLIVVAATILLCGGVFGVHHFQVRSQSSVYRDRAERAAVASETDPAQRGEAVRLYKQYLKFNPRDEASYQKYAALQFADAKADPTPATVERAAAGVEDFLRAFPNHPEERQKLAELYLSTGQGSKFPLVKQHIEMLFTAPTGDYRTNIEVREMAAECELVLDPVNGIDAALVHLQAALETGKAPVRVYVRAMELHYLNKKDRESRNKIVALLTALRSGRFEKSLQARIAAARFEMVLGNMGLARDDMKYAFETLAGSSDPDALLAKAELELSSAKTPEEAVEAHVKAEDLLRKAFGLAPNNVAVGMLLAEVLWHQAKREDGIAVLKRTAEALGTVNDNYLMLVDRLLDLGETEVSMSMVDAKLAPDPNKKTIVLYFRGRAAVLKQDWPTALKLLDEASPLLTRIPIYHKKAMVGLAACYAARQNPDQQLEYCRRALKDDGGYVLAIIGEAEALVKMGKHEEAVKRYRAIVNIYRLNTYRPELVRLELIAALSRPPEERDWGRFDHSLGEPPAATADVIVLRSDALAAQGKSAEAEKLLRKWLTDNPKDPKAGAVWVALARVADGGKVESAAAILDEAEKALGKTVEVRLARAALLLARAKPPTPAELEALAVDADKLSQTDRFRLLFGLGAAAARVADRADDDASKAARGAALAYLRAAADLSPKDLSCRAMLLDQALAAGRTELVQQVIREMATVEGETGPVGTLALIAVRLPDVKKLTDPGAHAAAIEELRGLARRVRDLRPGWSRVYVALAQLDELDGRHDDALANYTTAIDLGERQESVIRRTVDLYRLKQKDAQAVGLLDKLSNDVRLPDDLERYRSIHRLLASAIPKEARATIDRIAPFNEKDHRILMLRGALLDVLHEDAEALAAFRRAVELADTLPETWGSLIAQLLKHGKLADAKQAVAEAEKKLAPAANATPEQRAERLVAIGGLREVVGDARGALAHYVAARDAAPNELNPTRQLVLFLQRTGAPAKADELMAAAKGSAAPTVARWARRHLAITLMASPDAYARRAEALALVEQNLSTAPDDSEDLKARAVVWTVDPVTREEGVRVLRKFAERNDLTPDELYLIGQLAFDQGNFLEAAKYFDLAARPRPGVGPRHLAGRVRVYLALDQLNLAEEAVERLKSNFPRSWESTREEARLLHRRSKEKAAQADFDDARKLLDDARTVVKKFPGWDTGANLITLSGPLFDELGLTSEAEAAFAKYLTDNPDQPGAHAALAVHYIRQKQPEKAIELARKYEKKSPVLLTARLLTGAARAKRLDPVTESQIDRWLDAALKDAAGKPDLEVALIGSKAELLDAHGKSEEAIAEYERAMKRGPSDLVVNNLCMLLALYAPERADEAVKMMSQLIAIRGPVPSFLDTRAVAYLVSARPELATKDLQLALVQMDRPAYRFHLAWAIDLDQVKERRIFAIDELKRAKRLGLTPDDLHALEHKKYIEMMTKYKLPVE
jgi:tetratricopeptide (TPR) repeat protein